jgi:O-antigen/teichoic acid export membrane protein
MDLIARSIRAARHSASETLRGYLTESGRQAAKNLAGLVLFRLLSQGALVGTVLILTRSLSKPEFGSFMVAITLQPYLLLLSGSSLIMVAVREISRDPSKRGTVFGSYVLITGTASLIVFGLTTVAVLLLPLSVAERTLLCLVALGNVAAALDLQPFFDASHEQAKWGALTFSGDLLALVGIVIAWQLDHLTISVLGCLLALKWVVGTLGQYTYLRLTGEAHRIVVSLSTVRSLLRSAWPLTVTQLVTVIPVSGGVFLVRIFHGNAAVGSYGLATQIAAAFTMIAVLAHRIIQPHAAGPHGMERSFFRKMVIFYAIFSGALLVAVIGCTTIVVLGFLPPNYSDVLLLGTVLLVGGMMYSAAGIGGIYLVVLRREVDVLRGSFLTTVIYVVMALLLIPRYAAPAAAVASTVSSSLLFLVFSYFALRAVRNRT